jgi:hypothetical protein
MPKYHSEATAEIVAVHGDRVVTVSIKVEDNDTGTAESDFASISNALALRGYEVAVSKTELTTTVERTSQTVGFSR